MCRLSFLAFFLPLRPPPGTGGAAREADVRCEQTLRRAGVRGRAARGPCSPLTSRLCDPAVGPEVLVVALEVREERPVLAVRGILLELRQPLPEHAAPRALLFLEPGKGAATGRHAGGIRGGGEE